MNRRQWLMLGSGLLGCALASSAADAKRRSGSAMSEGAMEESYPVFRVSGKNYGELGRDIGEQAGPRIRSGLEARRKWVDGLVDFMEADSGRMDSFLTPLREHLPRLEEELLGMAEGAGVPFKSLLAVMLNPELNALMKGPSHEEDCTTAAVSAGGKIMIGHNEDGSCSYREHMYILDIRWPAGGSSLCLCYPGYLPGNGPSINSHGIVQTVNYIGARGVVPGIPRYAIDRAIMEAENLAKAVSLATHPKRAYSQHHLLASASEKKMAAVETSHDRFSIIEVSGVYVHANHYVHPDMAAVPQFSLYKGSSLPRQQVAQEWAKSFADPAAIGGGDIAKLLSSHQNYPLSICRHPTPKFSGCTLGSALVEVSEKRVKLLRHEPCKGSWREFSWPG